MTIKADQKEVSDLSIEPSDEDLVSEIKNGKSQTAKLETDDKVLARVTDGIYRVPGSAIRELISNSYDADAENVFISTDVPRFNSMTIRDDGNGMSVDTLVNMIRHIGGSAKRTSKGKGLEVTDAKDTSLSPKKKRKLIGKIGIGIFSVAQLTRDFEIITKQKGDEYYSRAKVTLFNYSDENITEEAERGQSFQTGNVEIWTEPTENINAHGTDIILKNIKKSAKEQLQSVEVWGLKENETDKTDDDEDDIQDSSNAILPSFHVGSINSDVDGTDVYDVPEKQLPNLPWDINTDPKEKFSLLYNAILEKTKNAVSPKLSHVLDNYLDMIWSLGLSIPLPYIEKHPFNLTSNDISDIFALSNKKKGQVTDISDLLKDGKGLGEKLGFISQNEKNDFNVTIDDIQLFRPIKFTDLPESKAVVKKPILFVGKYETEFSEMDIKDSAGGLSFEAYILWSPKVSPKDHNGSLIRINNASGIMFDDSFMKYQVAEQTIKGQLIAEIFVHKGLDSALNIDRESFNVAHPHYQLVMKWLHSAIRQVINKYKKIKKDKKIEIVGNNANDFSRRLNSIVEKRYIANKRDPRERSNLVVSNPAIESDGSKEVQPISFNEDLKNTNDNFLISNNKLSEVFESIKTNKPKQLQLMSKSEALLQILDSYGILDNLTLEIQESLVIDLIEIMKMEG